jgi:hypothetical protein
MTSRLIVKVLLSAFNMIGGRLLLPTGQLNVVGGTGPAGIEMVIELEAFIWLLIALIASRRPPAASTSIVVIMALNPQAEREKR